MVKEIINTTSHLVIFIALVVAFLYLCSLSEKIRRFVYKQEYLRIEKLGMILFFGILGILASEYGLKLIGVVVNVRDCIAIFAGILGGPVVGIGAGLISGLYRITGLWWTGWTGTLGYWSALGCGLATIGAGFLGAWLSKYKNINIKRVTPKQIWKIVGITAIWEIIHLHVIVPLTSPLYTEKTFWGIESLFFQKVLLPMILANALGILLFLFITRDSVIKREAEIAEREIIEAEIRKREIEKR
ncbi:MAG: LytS/YhcK type 5TM receptor domain-containing protein [Patescibacteria group bacterium]|nr:LytS/YhcK type 5TM receptor domain-containing protein [Patescibacteria group bacterium]